jgi:hypothetical protein
VIGRRMMLGEIRLGYAEHVLLRLSQLQIVVLLSRVLIKKIIKPKCSHFETSYS